MEQIRLLSDQDQEIAYMQARILGLASEVPNRTLQILEAGCGRRWPMDLRDIKYHLTGIDIYENALAIRKNQVGDLDETILGDLCSIDLPDESFDVIYNSYVLEHIPDAQAVMERFVRWLKPGGLILIRFPDGQSVYGFMTRITPHWFHLFFKRYIQGWKMAGQPGYGPYRTYYHPIVSRDGMSKFARKSDLKVIEVFGDSSYFSTTRIPTPVFRLLTQLVSISSLGFLTWRYNNLAFVLKKCVSQSRAGPAEPLRSASMGSLPIPRQ